MPLISCDLRRASPSRQTDRMGPDTRAPSAKPTGSPWCNFRLHLQHRWSHIQTFSPNPLNSLKFFWARFYRCWPTVPPPLSLPRLRAIHGDHPPPATPRGLRGVAPGGRPRGLVRPGPPPRRHPRRLPRRLQDRQGPSPACAAANQYFLRRSECVHNLAGSRSFGQNCLQSCFLRKPFLCKIPDFF